MQLQKLGVIPFDEKLGGSTLVSYQEMWANHGDTISKQYAGTAAMKVQEFTTFDLLYSDNILLYTHRVTSLDMERERSVAS